MKYYYIFKNKVVSFDCELPCYYVISERFEEKNSSYIPLSNKQVAFYKKNKNASVVEIYNMKINEVEEEVLSNSQMREIEYEKRLPRSLLDAFITYTAERNVKEAEKAANEIARIKNEIRSKYPD